jgi:hypothetical protein
MTVFRKIALALCFMTLALPTVAQTTGKLSRTASSSIRSARDKNGKDVIITTNRRFTFAEVYPNHSISDKDNYSMVLLEEFSSEWSPGVERNKAKVRVDGWAGKFPNPSRKVWTIISDGDEGRGDGNFYKVRLYGCCEDPSTQVWFSLIDGRKVHTSSIDPIRVFVPGSSADLNQYFGWHSPNASIEPPELGTVQNLRGVLQYSSERKSLRRLLVRSDLDLYFSKIAIRHQGELYEDMTTLVTGMGLQGSYGKKDKPALSGFSVVITLSDGEDRFEVEIPVENDELQTGSAKVPDKIILEAAK